MTDAVLDHEPVLRFGTFFLLLVGFLAWEAMAPRRMSRLRRWRRAITNLSLLMTGNLAGRLLGPIVATGAAVTAEAAGIGLFNSIVMAPFWLEAVVVLVLLDFSLWFQHWILHQVPLFWRAHKVHHSDGDFDVLLAVRFHPFETVPSALWKVVVVLALGASPLVVLAFEIALNGFAMFNHANIKLPAAVDRILRIFVVTPDMHRVHHSIKFKEQNRNFGFCLSVWDRLFGTYRPQPANAHETMDIGIETARGDEPERALWTLLLPFKPPAS